mmetsp:Transcript_28747/g.61295  ORF Transcript_28747/g.61295 Transcript_28747/m.61295 type:complete len:579 (-) Transcript_28747:24-1760(-)
MKTIERLYRKSNKTPVVLLCHSMGCKIGHYLLNFLLLKVGQAWIDRHIHSYVPVGAPHLGAQKSIRGMIDGDKMGLDAFLDKDEGLMLGRSLGSVPGLFPFEESVGGADSTMIPPQSAVDATLPQSHPIPTAILRHESSLRISLPAQCLHLKSFVHNRRRLPPTKLRLALQIGDDIIIRTSFVSVTKGGRGYSQLQVNFPDAVWLIACPPTIEQTLSRYPYIQLHLEEPGAGSAPKQRSSIFHLDILWIFRLVCCLIEWIFCCPCAVVWKLGCCVIGGVKKGADMTAALLGDFRVIGQSGRVDWKKGVIDTSLKTNISGGEGGGTMMYQIFTKIQATDGIRYGFFLSKPTAETLTIYVRWEPCTTNLTTSSMVCHSRHKNARKHGTFDIMKRDISYNACNINQLLQMEGLTDAIHLVKETYEKDPLGPLSLSAWQPPPVKKVIAIYGVNLATEIAGVYRRNPSVRISMSNTPGNNTCHAIKQLFVLDKEAKLDDTCSDTHIIEEGIIKETRTTPQKIIGGGTKRKSGDGTVSYWSLQHCKSWQGKCDVTVHEIDGAEHRAILNDKRFHTVLLELLGCK